MSETVRVELVPLGVSLEVRRGAALGSVLAEQGLEFPCGGSELCGGCRVRLLEGTLTPTPNDKLALTEQEIASGWRLACQAHAETTLKLHVEQWGVPILSDQTRLRGSLRSGLGIAVDVGTTTLVAQMIDLATGDLLGVRTALNPQTAFGADIMTRLRFALTKRDLTPLIRETVGDMVSQLAAGRESDVAEAVLVGNTVMHHLFAGVDLEPLSHVPFASPELGEQRFTPRELNWKLPQDCCIRFVSCIGGFVGSDVLAGILAVNLSTGAELTALIDLGTNGEIALGNQDRILCASTAAGPAFEAGSIRMGMRAATGAIAQVSNRSGKLECAVIGDVAPRGICGSGLVDAVAAGLENGAILPSGRLANGAREFPLMEPVIVSQADIRELQLAKGAIAAGLRILLGRWGATMQDLRTVYLAGAFGNYVRIESAARIGLLEMAGERVVSAGNTALRGAKLILLSEDVSMPKVEHVSLAADAGFQETFVDCMGFPDAANI
ncbi:MAG: ASKHA domain-containing protein [Candidatus Korobacteraceae bacterium]